MKNVGKYVTTVCAFKKKKKNLQQLFHRYKPSELKQKLNRKIKSYINQ